jgi:hypothetical protein
MRVLMFELDNFDVDLSELDINLNTEHAYRHLRAACKGKARDVLDLEIEYGMGKNLKQEL